MRRLWSAAARHPDQQLVLHELDLPVATRSCPGRTGEVAIRRADHNDEQVLDALDGFVDQLAVFAEPSGNSAADSA